MERSARNRFVGENTWPVRAVDAQKEGADGSDNGRDAVDNVLAKKRHLQKEEFRDKMDWLPRKFGAEGFMQ